MFSKAIAIGADHTGVIATAPSTAIVIETRTMSQDLFQVTAMETATVVELALPHTLDSDEFDQLNESLLNIVAANAGGRWVLDLTRLSYAGSAALGLMVNIRQRVLDAGGELVLCGLSPRLLQVFRTCCMERLFTIRSNRADAFRAIRA